HDAPKDGKDEEESGIPALYTYLGQFIDHDLTFDPASSLQKQNDPNALVDYRTPAFDLDCIYGRGPGDQPYLYDGDQLFLLGDPLRGRRSWRPRPASQQCQPAAGPHRRSPQRREQHRLATPGVVPSVPQPHGDGESGPDVCGDSTAGPVPLSVCRPERLPSAHRAFERSRQPEVQRTI